MNADRADTPAGRLAPGPAVIGAVTAVVLGLLAVIVVSRSTPAHVFTVHLGTGRPTPSSSSARPGRLTTTLPPKPTGTTHLPTAVLVIAVALFALGAVAMLLWAWLLAPRHGRSRRRRRRAAARGAAGRLVDAAPSDEARTAVASAVTTSLDDLIDRGDVATAIIRSWLAVEAALHDAGLAARRSDTSTDLVERALASLGVGEDALRSLASLYREARFSTHPLGEEHRASARRDLAMIASDLVGSTHAV